jgi:hypothetical protein
MQKFTVQILGTVNYESYYKLQMKIMEVLATFPSFKQQAVNITTWVDGRGEPREYTSDGLEIISEEPVTVFASEASKSTT